MLLNVINRRRLLGAGASGLLAALPGAHAALSLPPQHLFQARLSNGLQVVVAPDEATPTAAIQVWYQVGGRDDPPGRSGFAHLFEHMMFKATEHMPDEMFDRLTEDVGGHNNAFTTEDVTAYQNLVPANHAERLIWAEAQRMASLKLTQAAFDSERQVVEEEYRERVLASPYGRLFNALPGLAFAEHPYRRPVIGNLEELRAATLADVQAFHARYYRPDNAVLIVTGQVDAAQVLAWAQQYFGPVRPAAAAVLRSRWQEPRRARARHVALSAPQVPVPAVALQWQGPSATSADAPALQVAAALLGSGEASRLNEALVLRRHLAQSAGFSADLYAQAGSLTAWAMASGRTPVATLQAALRAEVQRLARAPIALQELQRVRAQLLAAALVARQRPEGQAEALGWACSLHGDPAQAERELAQLQAVGTADVQRVLSRHVLGGHALSLHYTQERAT